jgi:hypothetical protein
MFFTQNEILQELNTAFQSTYQPNATQSAVDYYFFLDLEHGYFHTADSRIHLYADANRWAIVFEKSGYDNRAFQAVIDLHYIGNCVDYIVEEYDTYTATTNTKFVYLIENREFNRIQNKTGSELEQFELIDPKTKSIRVRKKHIPIALNANEYEQLGIKVRDYDNPRRLIGFEDVVRYLATTQPDMIRAKEQEIRTQLPVDLPKLMTINGFHHLSVYDEKRLPSQVETYQLLANILVERNPDLWKPILPPNNHWSNWESGHL